MRTATLCISALCTTFGLFAQPSKYFVTRGDNPAEKAIILRDAPKIGADPLPWLRPGWILAPVNDTIHRITRSIDTDNFICQDSWPPFRRNTKVRIEAIAIERADATTTLQIVSFKVLDEHGARFMERATGDRYEPEWEDLDEVDRWEAARLRYKNENWFECLLNDLTNQINGANR